MATAVGTVVAAFDLGPGGVWGREGPGRGAGNVGGDRDGDGDFGWHAASTLAKAAARSLPVTC